MARTEGRMEVASDGAQGCTWGHPKPEQPHQLEELMHQPQVPSCWCCWRGVNTTGGDLQRVTAPCPGLQEHLLGRAGVGLGWGSEGQSWADLLLFMKRAAST